LILTNHYFSNVSVVYFLPYSEINKGFNNNIAAFFTVTLSIHTYIS
jgi:hypothetical protein